jgi:threonine dehydrogenase-like Zn-dependent dehydrogenase
MAYKKVHSKKIVLQGKFKISIETETLDIDNLYNNQIAAETLFSAISPGTEVSAFKGDPPLRPMKVYPRVVGYCNVGQIVAVGKGVEEYQIGDIILTNQSHRSAFVCSADLILAKVPEDACLPQTSTTYLFHLGYNALLQGDVRPGCNVAVLGLGTLGLTTVAVSKLFGAKTMALTGREYIFPIATEMGADIVVNKDNPKLGEIISSNFYETGIDVLVTTSNSWKDWKIALEIPRKKGKICVLGFPGRTHPIPDFNPLDSRNFYDKQLNIIGCGYTPKNSLPPEDLRFNLKRNCKYLLEQILNGTLPADKIISAVVAWTEIEDLYQALLKRKKDLITAVLKWK